MPKITIEFDVPSTNTNENIEKILDSCLKHHPTKATILATQDLVSSHAIRFDKPTGSGMSSYLPTDLEKDINW